jgi:hypothetical protein
MTNGGLASAANSPMTQPDGRVGGTAVQHPTMTCVLWHGCVVSRKTEAHRIAKIGAIIVTNAIMQQSVTKTWAW